MQIYTGTSGYSYKEWKGPFYPEKLSNSKMLSYYAEHLRTVEINNTFYRMPKASVVANWATQVPDGFVFVIKAPRRITHHSKLEDTEEPLGYLWTAVQELGPHLGPILFQLPPYFRIDLPRLQRFLSSLPDGLRAVFEFRHQTWRDDDVHAALRASNVALCTADVDGEEGTEIISTADWGYLRLRRTQYDDGGLEHWADRVRAQGWRQAFVFFKHEDEGCAPRLASQFAALFADSDQ